MLLHEHRHNADRVKFHVCISVLNVSAVTDITKIILQLSNIETLYIWADLCENVSSGICGQRRPRSTCASAQSDQSLHCQLTESLDTTECMNGEQSLGSYFAHA